jgi:hypothetical protein
LLFSTLCPVKRADKIRHICRIDPHCKPPRHYETAVSTPMLMAEVITVFKIANTFDAA